MNKLWILLSAFIVIAIIGYFMRKTHMARIIGSSIGNVFLQFGDVLQKTGAAIHASFL